MLNFALNLFYLEGQFLSVGLTGQGLDPTLLTGVGAAGQVAGALPAAIADTELAERLREILLETVSHIALFRELLGGEAVAQPTIDLGAAGGPFGVIGGRTMGYALNPYASATLFLLGSFYLLETSVSLLKRLAWQMTTRTLADATAAVLTTKAAHAGIIRLNIYRRRNISSAETFANRISDFRESLNNSGVDLDQGVTLPNGAMNLLPSSPAGYLPERTPAETRPLVYLAAPAAERGGFFPNGLNGNLARP